MANDTRSTAVTASAAPVSVPSGSSTEQLLAQTLAKLTESQAQIAEMMQQQTRYNEAALRIAPRRKKSMGEYLAERQKRGATKFLPHQVYQNGRPVNPSGLSQETINTLDTLATGHYCDGIVDVIRISDGPKGINSRIHLMYNNGNDMERMSFYMRFPTLTKLITDIAAEMKANNIAPVIEKGQDPPQFDFPENL